MKKLCKFIFVFLIIGLESLGNMSAIQVILEENLIKKNKWINQEDLIDGITISRLGPGATSANVVAFLGNKIAGFWGGALATICYTVLPMIVIIFLAGILDKIIEFGAVVSALRGCLICICVMFIKSTYDMGKGLLKNTWNIYVFIISLVMIILFNISGVFVIIGTIIIGVMKMIIKNRK